MLCSGRPKHDIVGDNPDGLLSLGNSSAESLPMGVPSDMSKFHSTSPAEVTAGLIATDYLMAGDSEEEEEEEEDKKQSEDEDSELQDERNGYSE